MFIVLLLRMNSTLLPDLNGTSFQILRIPSSVFTLIMARNQIRCISKQIIHFLERQTLRLRQEQIEEQRIRKVADDEQVVVPISNVRHCRVGDLADEGVEGEADHGGDRDTFGAGPRVEDLGGDDPREWPAGGGKGEVVEPGTDDEAPGSSVVVC